jgi:hypothetical protein
MMSQSDYELFCQNFAAWQRLMALRAAEEPLEADRSPDSYRNTVILPTVPVQGLILENKMR